MEVSTPVRWRFLHVLDGVETSISLKLGILLRRFERCEPFFSRQPFI
jgi:hypothetical protein